MPDMDTPNTAPPSSFMLPNKTKHIRNTICLLIKTATALCMELKHTTTLFSLYNHDIVSREWIVSVDQVQTNYHGRPMAYGTVDNKGFSLWLDVF